MLDSSARPLRCSRTPHETHVLADRLAQASVDHRVTRSANTSCAMLTLVIGQSDLDSWWTNTACNVVAQVDWALAGIMVLFVLMDMDNVCTP